MSETPSKTVIRVWARLMRAQQLALASVERELKAAGLPSLVWYDVLLEVERAGGEGLRPFELERAMLLGSSPNRRLTKEERPSPSMAEAPASAPNRQGRPIRTATQEAKTMAETRPRQVLEGPSSG